MLIVSHRQLSCQCAPQPPLWQCQEGDGVRPVGRWERGVRGGRYWRRRRGRCRARTRGTATTRPGARFRDLDKWFKVLLGKGFWTYDSTV